MGLKKFFLIEMEFEFISQARIGMLVAINICKCLVIFFSPCQKSMTANVRFASIRSLLYMLFLKNAYFKSPTTVIIFLFT